MSAGAAGSVIGGGAGGAGGVLARDADEGAGEAEVGVIVRKDGSVEGPADLPPIAVSGGIFELQRTLDGIERLAERIKPFGWHIEFLMHVDEFPTLDMLLKDFPVDVVFGHLGYMPMRHGVASPAFQSLLRLMRDGRAWVTS